MAILSKLISNGVGEVGQEFLAQQVTVTKTQGSFVKMLVYGLLVKTPLTQAYNYVYKQLLFIYPNMPVILKMFLANLVSSPLGSIAYYFALDLSYNQKSYFEKYKKYFIYTSLVIPPLLRFITEKTVPYKFRQRFVFVILLAYNFFVNLHFKRIEESIQMKCCKKLSIKDVDIENKRILIRVDYNVPIDIQGSILDNSLIIASLPTIQYCIKNKARSIILISHLDEPGGQPQKDLSLGPVANELNRLLGRTIQFIPKCTGYDVERICNMAKDGDIILLENLKFHQEEDILIRKKSNPKTYINERFRKYINSLSNLADIFVNDTYSLSNSEYTSLVSLTIPVKVSGLLLKRELDVISLTLDTPKTPFVAIIGGLDIKENCELIYNLLEKVNILIIVGNLAFVFKHVLNNIKIGSSEYDSELVSFVNNVIEKARKYRVELFFPIDYIIANKLSKDCKVGITNDNHGIPDGWIGVDVGPKSNIIFNKIILSAKTIFWLGVAGYHEIDKFSKGTRHIIESIAESTLQGAISIAAGKDTVKAIAKYKAQNKICHISTGNSKTFEYLDCNMLPGVIALSNKI